MPRPQDLLPKYEEVMMRVLDPLSGPISIKEFSEKVLALRPSQAKNPLQAIRNQLRQENGRLFVFLDAETLLPLRLAMQGVRFRIQLDRDTVNTGMIRMDDSLSSYLPRQFPLEKIQFLDNAGHPIDFKVSSITKKLKSPFGAYDDTAWVANLKTWFLEQKVYPKAYFLFTIIDWQNGIIQLEHEPYAKRDFALLQQRNQLLADLFYEMLENAAQEDLIIREAVPTVYAHLPEKNGYPPDHWMVVLEKDKRMSVNDWDIRYSDGAGSMFDDLVQELAGESKNVLTLPFSKEQGKLIYRFKAELKDQPKIWRIVEIQGTQTLSDLNHILVSAFHHDWEHLGGFWKLVPRHATSRGRTRYREVELGEVNPFGEGDGADLKIAGLELSTGDRLKFVFDFGDWIEHTLIVDAIEAPQAGVKYPREVARNKPKYVNCVECEKKGRQVVAKWICLDCSNRTQKEVVLCGKCVKKHEEHYVEEILY
jgi:hypothetical protein